MNNIRTLESTAFRYGRFLPELLPTIQKMRIDENLVTQREKPTLPHVRNAQIVRVPSEDIGAQVIMQQNMKKALDDMHQSIVDGVSHFINNKERDLDWMLSPTTVDYLASIATNDIVNYHSKMVIAAADANDPLDSLLKLMTFFAAYFDSAAISPRLIAKALIWYTDAKPLLDQIKFGVRNSNLLNPNGIKPEMTEKVQLDFVPRLKSVRRAMKDRETQLDSIIPNKAKKALLSNLLTYFNSLSQNAFTFIGNNVGSLGDNDLNHMFVPQTRNAENVHDEIAKLANLSKKHGGKGPRLTQDEIEKLRDKDPELVKDYNKQNALTRNALKTEIKKFVRDSAQKLVTIAKLRKYFEDQKLPTYFIPKGFTGKVDEDYNFYTDTGIKWQSSMWGGTVISMNPDFNGDESKYIAKVQALNAAAPSYMYSEGWARGGRSAQKFEKVHQNIENLEDIKAKWREDFKHPDHKIKLQAFLAEALFQLSIRIGSEKQGSINRETGEREQTFGLTTLQVRHIQPDKEGTGLIISFTAKSRVKQEYHLKPSNTFRAQLITFIKRQLKNKGANDYVWTWGPPQQNNIMSGSAVNSYLDSIGFVGGSHKLRSVNGTLVFEAYIKKNPPPKKFSSIKDADTYIRKALKVVGETLGHKRSDENGNWLATELTAPAYIDMQTVKQFFLDHGFARLPNWLENKT